MKKLMKQLNGMKGKGIVPWEVKSVEKKNDNELLLAIQTFAGVDVSINVAIQKRKLGLPPKEVFIIRTYFGDFVEDKSAADSIAKAIAAANEVNARVMLPVRVSIDKDFDLAIDGIFWREDEAYDMVDALMMASLMLIAKAI